MSLVVPRAIDEVLAQIELIRAEAERKLSSQRRAEMGQYFTPMSIARAMASMFDPLPTSVRLLDAGAGIGSLSAAVVVEACGRFPCPAQVIVTTYEADVALEGYLQTVASLCSTICGSVGSEFRLDVRQKDFIAAGTSMLRGGLFDLPSVTFNTVVLNPPYQKIHSRSRERLLLRSVGIETTNLYTGFLAIATGLLEPGGQLVAITPRSFANGPYFRPFRNAFLGQMTLKRIHVFESRDAAFQHDDVLQENVIFHAVKGGNPGRVLVTSSTGPDDLVQTVREVDYDQIVHPEDAEAVIHVVPSDMDRQVSMRMERFTAHLSDLNLTVSTGRVVDFRASNHLRSELGQDTAPLIYPSHISSDRFISWPKIPSKKPNALAMVPETLDLFVPTDTYVLVKRFSAKEERRRVVAAVYDPTRLPSTSVVAFENHLNYYHSNGKGMPKGIAKGLAAFLNSTLVDEFFRQRSGHTQVNATDLRSLRYPTREQLESLGARIKDAFPTQAVIDLYIEEELLGMSTGPNPIHAKQKVNEALDALRDLGLPRGQQNERSALILLALLGLAPDTGWADASDPLIGITPMMQFTAKYYGKNYAPNTRETVRRQTVHQFVEAGFVLSNPDEPYRPINSGKTVYQIEPAALRLFQSYGTPEWGSTLARWIESVGMLRERYAQDREMKRIPVSIAEGHEITLSPGGQNVLVKQIIDEFCPRFVPGGELIYVGDTDTKWAYFDREAFVRLDITVDEHGKMPDVVVYYGAKDWLVLIEAVTSHGPVNPKRRAELQVLFTGSKAGLVFVTAFIDRRTMAKYLPDISWETDVWVAEAPGHMVHFNGEHFLGPY